MDNPLHLSTRPGTTSRSGKHIGKLPVFCALLFMLILVGGIIVGISGRVNKSDPNATGAIEVEQAEEQNTVDTPVENFDVELVDLTEPPVSSSDNSNIEQENKISLPPLVVRKKRQSDAIKLLLDQQGLEELKSRTIGRQSTSRIEFVMPKELSAIPPQEVVSVQQQSTAPSSFDRTLLARLAQLNGSPDSDPNGQAAKQRFLSQTPPLQGYLPDVVSGQLSPYEIKTGTVIPSMLLTEMNSDLPGMVLGQVTANVYDTATGQYLLIPQGSRLVGAYDSQIKYGQNRALVVWRRLVMPNGATLNLSSMPGVDQGGATGFKDKVNRHFGTLLTSILGLSVFQAIPSLVTGEAKSAGESELDKISATNISKTGEKLIEKNLARQPTIRIRRGYRFNVLVDKDILFTSVYLR